MNIPKILITGSNGFIFSDFIRKFFFLKKPYQLVSIDACFDEGSNNSQYVNKGHKFYIANILDKHQINTIFKIEKPDIVIHGAALNEFQDAWADTSLMETNVIGTQNVINACKVACVKKLIFISSSAVYGDLNKDVKLATEDSPTNPNSVYGVSKLAGEGLIRSADIPYQILRPVNLFGTKQNIKSSAISKIITDALLQNFISVNSNILHEWMYVEDFSSALFAILERGKYNNIYNLSSNFRCTDLQILNDVSEILETKEKLKFEQFELPEQMSLFQIDASKIRALKWEPEYKFRKGLKIVCNWLVNNEWFWKRK